MMAGAWLHKRKRTMSHSEQMQEIYSLYIEEKGEVPVTMHEVADWAIRHGHWKPQPADMVSRCAEELSRALRNEYFTDPQGRRVRAKHAATIKENQSTFTYWDDIRTASREHMGLAFQQRRVSIVADCRQLNNDVSSYNQNNNDGTPIQMIWDFTYDIQELEEAI